MSAYLYGIYGIVPKYSIQNTADTINVLVNENGCVERLKLCQIRQDEQNCSDLKLNMQRNAGQWCRITPKIHCLMMITNKEIILMTRMIYGHCVFYEFCTFDIKLV